MAKQVVTYSPDNARIYLYLQKHLPAFLRLLDPSPKRLQQIEDKIELRYEQTAKALRAKGVFEAETTLIDLFWKVDERDIHSIQFLNFIERACRGLIDHVPARLLPKLANTLFQMIVNFDEAKSRYGSYIGEISVLDKLLGDLTFELADIEYAMPNGKCADYAFTGKKGMILTEIENIDLNVEKIETGANLDSIIEYRTEKKLKDKYGNLPLDWPHEIYLVQVVWGDILKLKHLKESFSRRTSYKNIVPKLMTVAQFFDQKAEIPRYLFMTAEEFLGRSE